MKSTSTHRATPKSRASATFSASITEELRRYDDHLRDVRGLASGTRKGFLRVVGLLLQQKFKGRSIEMSRLRPDDIRQFLARQLEAHRTASNASHHAASLRSYFRYRATCGDPVSKLTAVISNPAPTGRRLPMRAYAIVRCALDLGLRAGEIARLAMSDIDWRAGTVTLKGTKSLRQDVLPLPVATGQALAQYLQHERPVTPHTALFVRCIAGEDHPITSCAIQKVIKRACRRIGLPTASAHALRHTVACRLVEHGSSLKEVADVLRHRSLNTTLIYAKLDTLRLSTVPLPWPGSGS